MRRLRVFFLLLLIGMIATGCTRRTITITSEPAGALVWLNGREVGRTPVTVDFLYYGNYDVQLVADGFEPLLTTGDAVAPIWDIVPFDFVAEVTPFEKHSRIAWHYDLAAKNDDLLSLVERAQLLRTQVAPPATVEPPLPSEPSALPTEPAPEVNEPPPPDNASDENAVQDPT